MPFKSSLQKNGSMSLQSIEKKHTWFLPIPNPDLSIHSNNSNGTDNFSTWNLEDAFFPPTGLFFASVGQIGCQTIKTPASTALLGETSQLEEAKQKKSNKKGKMKLRIKIANPHLRRLISGAVAGALSRTAVAPLETIRTHLMVGSNGNSTTEVFQSIMETEGWTGLFRGNFVNVIRVAPSKAIEV
jgi:solute carrier family 25 (mitochondrial phosphate transporter), member 23/24/25/41